MKTLPWKGLTALLAVAIAASVAIANAPGRGSVQAPTAAGEVRSAASSIIFGPETPANNSLHGLLNPVTVIIVPYFDTLPKAVIVAVDFHLDGMNLTSAGVFNNSAFVMPVGFALRDGPHFANFTLLDNYTLVAYHNWTFTVDTIPPILIVTSPAYPLVNTSAIPVAGTAFPALAAAAPVTVAVTVLPSHVTLGTVANATTGAFQLFVPLTEGTNVLFVNATDAAGNLASEIKSLISDTIKPVLIVLSPQNRSVVSTSIVRVSGISEFGAYLTVNGFSVVVAPNGTWSVDLALPDGLDLIYVAAADQVGNLNYAVLGVLVDSDAPRVTLTSPFPAITNSSSMTISGFVNDTKTVALILQCNQIFRPLAWSPTTGYFTTTLVGLPDATYTCTVTAVDAAQRSTTLTAVVVVDTTPPVVTVAQPPDGLETNQSTVRLTGTVDDSHATVLVNDQVIRPDATGRWTTIVALVQGSNVIVITAVDPAGNRATPIQLHVDYYSPFPGLENRTAANEANLDNLGAVTRLSLVGILLLTLAVVFVLYMRVDRKVRENRRILAAVVRSIKKKP